MGKSSQQQRKRYIEGEAVYEIPDRISTVDHNTEDQQIYLLLENIGIDVERGKYQTYEEGISLDQEVDVCVIPGCTEIWK